MLSVALQDLWRLVWPFTNSLSLKIYNLQPTDMYDICKYCPNFVLTRMLPFLLAAKYQNSCLDPQAHLPTQQLSIIEIRWRTLYISDQVPVTVDSAGVIFFDPTAPVTAGNFAVNVTVTATSTVTITKTVSFTLVSGICFHGDITSHCQPFCLAFMLLCYW